MRSHHTASLWQSLSDLAMGLVGVFCLILILLLIKEQQTAQGLAVERADFATELIALLEKSQGIIERQDRVQDWLSHVFDEGDCQLALSSQGQLVRKGQGGAPAQLYESGSVALEAEAEGALSSCLQSFYRLARCLSPTPDAIAECSELDADGPFADDPDVRSQLRRGIEALVLQGNTDKQRYLQAPAVVSRTQSGRLGRAEARSFVDNAYLGAERARQALAHLLALVENRGTGEASPLEVLMSRVRIESPSFGRYQAGPAFFQEDGVDAQWREGSCVGDQCEEARNLSLLLRWRKAALRQPFDELRGEMCTLLANPQSALHKGLIDAGEDPAVAYQRLCGDSG